MYLSAYENQYIDALKKIFESGYEDGTNERTGKATKRLPGIVIQVDVEQEFPILKSKFVACRTALREILWIWQQQSNNINDLKAHIWDEWADNNGAIGKAYGFQMNQAVSVYTDPVHKTPESFRAYKNQAEFILEYLREFPQGRWGVATLWNPTQLAGMNLVPCCHTSTWNLDGGRLNCVLDQRSGDMPYGVPFNTTQYAELMILLARDLGVKPGVLTHVIADAHIYDNQMDGVALQLANYEVLRAVYDGVMYKAENVDNEETKNHLCNTAYSILHKYNVQKEPVDLVNRAIDALYGKPEFKVTGDTDFFKVDVDNCVINGYNNMGKIDFGEVAV